MQISLNVFIFRTKEQHEQAEMGMEIPLDECDLEERTFYNINFIAPDSNGKQFCCIGSNGDEFTVNSSYEQVKELINNSRISKYN